jgi:uncharacterized protein YlxW (UPF0749 family)
MKKTILTIAVLSALTFSCSPKEEQPTETKEERASRERIERLRKSSDSLNRSADSLKEVQIHLEEFYDRAIRFTKAGLTESQAIQKVAETDSVGYALYLISQQQKK